MAEITTKPEIKPTKPVAKSSTKQLSSVVRVVSANPVPLNANNNAPKPISPKVQIVSSHVEVIDESKKSAPKSVVHVEAIDGSNSREFSTILPSRVEVVGGVSPSESCVVYLINFVISFYSFFLHYLKIHYHASTCCVIVALY